MKITLAKSAGFCFGVRRALRIAREISKTREKTYMLGDIVHNEDVVRDVQKLGIIKTKKLSKGSGKAFLIRAHGVSDKVVRKVKKMGYSIIDATCPMVKEIHSIVLDMERKGYRIIVIGDKKHDEVSGIVGQLKQKSLVIQDLKKIPIKALKKIKKAAVVVQSTQNVEKVRMLEAILRTHINNLKFFNTICKPTRTKQNEIRKLPLEHDIMIIIGSKRSANTKRLYEISKSLNKRTYWVNSKGSLRKDWFRGVKSVAITAGASTPDSTTKGVIDQIRSYS